MIRVTLVALTAVAVMAGVVASALLSRKKGHADEPPVASSTSRTPDAPSPFGPASPDRRHPMPSGCEVDAGEPPVARFDLAGDVLDLGAVRQGTTTVRDVSLRNAGSGVLCVRDVATGCGCVLAELLGENRIPPGTSGSIRVTVDTANREGRQEKAVRVFTNDPATKESVFQVVVDVRLGIVVVPSATGKYFGRHAPGKPGEIVVRLKCPKSDPAWEVTGVEGQRTKFAWSVKAVEPNDVVFRDYDLTIVHPGALEPILHTEDLMVKTTHPDRPEILLGQTQLLVVNKYFPGPPTVSFGYVGGAAAPKDRIALVMSGEGSTDFVVKGARIEGKGFAAKEPRKVPQGWAVDVSYDGAARKPGAIEAALVVSIDDAEMPEMRIPVRATVLGGE